MFEVLAIVLFLAWLGGIALHIAGGFIHILLVLAVAVLAVRFFQSAAR
jgi:hypothetical protein